MYHIIYNPVAGKKAAKKNLKKIERILQARNVPYEIHESLAEGDATNIVRRLTEQGEEEIIALGGDGTLHEVLNGLKDPSKCRLGLIPSGTGNDFAENVGIPLNAEMALLRILDGEVKDTDYLDVGGVRCMNVGGIGMDVEVLELCKRGKLKGKIKYLMSLVRCLFAFKGCRVEIENGEEKQKRDVLLAVACNGSQFGGGISICPTAEVDDGKISVVIVDCIGGKLKIIGAFMELMKGRVLEYPAATHFLCERVKFSPEKPCSAQLDGELYKELTFDVKICKGLKFYR